MGDLAAARLRFETSLAIIEKLVADDPQNAELRFDLALSHLKLFTPALMLDMDERRKRLGAADVLLDQLKANGQLQGFEQRDTVRAIVDGLLAKPLK